MSNNEPSQLNTDLAALLGFAAGHRTAAAIAIKQALQGLGIDKHTKSLTPDDKAAIIQWHKARLTDKNQLDIETIATPVVINEPIETTTIPTSPTDLTPVEIDVNRIKKQAENFADDSPLTEREKQLMRENVLLQSKLMTIYHKHAPTYPDNETVRLTVNHKQIALNGAYLNALMVATGIDKPKVKMWLESSVIDSKNVTESIKLLIVRNLESELIKARDVIK